MDAKLLKLIQPTADTSAAICAALDRISTANVDAVPREHKAIATIEAGALTLTSRECRDLNDQAEDANQDARQLALIAVGFNARLQEVLASEKRAAAMARRDDLRAQAAEHHARFEREYSPLHAALKTLLDERWEIHRAIARHNTAMREDGSLGRYSVAGDDLVDVLLEVSLAQDEAGQLATWRAERDFYDIPKERRMTAARLRFEQGDFAPRDFLAVILRERREEQRRQARAA